MELRFIHIIAALVTLVAVLSCGGADGLAPADSRTIARGFDSTLLAGLYASGPVTAGYIAPDRIAASGSFAPSAEVSWVSLVPGTVPDGATATIINLTDRGSALQWRSWKAALIPKRFPRAWATPFRSR